MTIRLRTRCTVAIAIVWTTAAGAQARDRRLETLDAYIEKARVEWKVPAMSVAIVKDDSVIFARGYGVLQTGKPERANEQTLFAIGSSSKAFTTAALAMLVDEGKVSFDSPAIRYLPSLQLPDPWVTREITVRDLVTHRVGLERADRIWGGTDFSRDEVLRRQRFLGRIASFRAQFGYNNHMFLAAGQIIPAVTGMSWDDFVRTRIFTPLGMRRSTTSTTPLANLDNVATPHALVGDSVIPVPWHNIDNIGPAGSINSSAAEMAQWLRLQLGRGKYAGRQLVAEKTLGELHTPQTVIPPEPWLSTASPVNHLMVPESHFFVYGMGWFLQDYKGRKIIQHGGAIDGMRAMVGFVPEEQLGIVVLTNLNPTSADIAVMFRTFDVFFAGGSRDWSHEMHEGVARLNAKAEERRKATIAARVPGTSPSLPLARYAGTYVDSAYGSAEVREEGGHLVMQFGRTTGDLAHWHYDTFEVTSREPTHSRGLVTFAIGEDGTPVGLHIGGVPDLRRSRQAPRAASSDR